MAASAAKGFNLYARPRASTQSAGPAQPSNAPKRSALLADPHCVGRGACCAGTWVTGWWHCRCLHPLMREGWSLQDGGALRLAPMPHSESVTYVPAHYGDIAPGKPSDEKLQSEVPAAQAKGEQAQRSNAPKRIRQAGKQSEAAHQATREAGFAGRPGVSPLGGRSEATGGPNESIGLLRPRRVRRGSGHRVPRRGSRRPSAR